MTRPRERARWLLVVVFAVGMAWVEAATVYYLRVMVDRIEPYQANPLPMHGVLGQVELVREAATLVMLLTVGMLAGRTWRSAARLYGDCVRRLGHFLLRVSASDLRLAEFAVRLGHPVPAAAAVVGAGARARLHRVADDRVGHARQPLRAGAGRRDSSTWLRHCGWLQHGLRRSRSACSWPTRCGLPAAASRRFVRSCRTRSIGRCSSSPWR